MSRIPAFQYTTDHDRTARWQVMAVALAALLLLPAVSFGSDDLAQAVVKHREMIVTANPLASAAGAKVLRQGGTAVDAMIAAPSLQAR